MIGTIFMYTANLMTNMPVRRTYEVMEELDNEVYNCKLLWDKSIPKINPDYREKWKKEDIILALTENPLLVV